MGDRWVVVPRIGTGDTRDAYRPKYAATDGLTGWSGQPVDMDQYPDISLSGWWFVTHFYGTDAALRTVTDYSDAYTRQEVNATTAEAATWLNNKTGRNRSWTQWTAAFSVGGL